MKTEWLTTKEAAELLGIHPTTLRTTAYRKRWGIVPHRVGKSHMRFKRDEIEALIRRDRFEADLRREEMREKLRPTSLWPEGGLGE